MAEFVLTPSPPATDPIIILDPSEVATADRIELDLSTNGLKIKQDGVDFGDAAIQAFMAEQAVGEAMIDYRLPNRTIKIPLIVSTDGVTSFDDARVLLEAKCARINDGGGGWLKYILPSGRYLFADLESATLHLSADWYTQNRDHDLGATLEFQAKPDLYGDPITLSSHTFFSYGGGSWTEQIKGNLPGRAELAVTQLFDNDQLGLAQFFRCRNYSSDQLAAWAYEAEDLTPLDLAAITTLSGASDGGSGSGLNNAVLHNNLGTDWTPLLSTNKLPKVRAVGPASSGTGDITLGFPSGTQPNDILIMFVETQTEAVNVPAGWAHVSGSPVTGSTVTKLTVLWKRYVAGDAAPLLKDPGDHQVARLMAVSGCISTGNPWDVTDQGTELISDTSVAVLGATTTVDGCLVLAAVSTPTDTASSAQISAWANADLQAVTEQMDTWTSAGSGGGFGVASGIKVKAGAYGATIATLATAAFKCLMTIALKPETGGNFLKHVGLYDVWARAYTTSATPPSLRMLSDVGDLISPSENDEIAIPGPNNFYLVPLGQINLRQVPYGGHRWQGVIQGRGESGGENAYIDRLEFYCADESSGILSAPFNPSVGLAGYVARDEFNQGTTSTATGVTAAAGGKYIALSGSDTTDFGIDGTADVLERTSTIDSGSISGLTGRAIGLAVGLDDTAFAFDFTLDDVNANLFVGQMVRTVDSSNHLLVYLVFSTVLNCWLVRVREVLKGSGVLIYAQNRPVPGLASAGAVGGRLLTQVVGDTLTVAISNSGGLFTQLLSLRADSLASTLAKGDAYVYDANMGSAAVTRTYDNLAIWVPDTDAVLFAGQDAQLTWRGNYRRGADGVAYGPVAISGGDYLRIPVSGPEGRPVEIGLRSSRGDYGPLPDSGLDGVMGQLTYRPCYSYIPES